MFIRSARGAAYRKEKRYRIWTVVIIFFFILILIKLCITTLLFYSYAIWNFHFFTGLGPCLPNNLSTYGARRFHISRSEWDRVFSRLTVVPGLSWFPIDEQEGKWNSWILPPATSPTATLRPPAASGKQASPLCWLGEEGISIAKDSIQPQVPLRLPCYDFTPVEDPTVVCANKTTKSLCGTSGTQKSWVIIGPMLRAKPIPRVWRAVCTGPGYIFTAACWSAITSDSNFMFPSCREQSELRQSFRIRSALQPCFPL